MRNFNWDAIPRHSVLGKRNVWTSQSPSSLEDFELDTQRMEEMFSRSDSQPLLPKTGMVKKAIRGLPPVRPGPQRVSILSSKKSMNVGIFLKQFKRPLKGLVDDLKRGNWLRFGVGKLHELCKLLPEEEEVKRLQAFSGDLTQLSEPDLFMVLLVKVPGYAERLKSLMLREEFFPLMDDMKRSIMVMIKAANELLNCDELHSIIRLVLKAGNYLNAGGYAGSAIGFRMASLLKLADTKANKPGMNLLHYVALQAQVIDASWLSFPDLLEHLGMAARVKKQEVESDFQREIRRVKEAKMDASRHPDLQLQMETFLMRAEARLTDLQTYLMDLNSLSQTVAEFFCEEPDTFQLEECCTIFHSFCQRFKMAIQDNREREAAEQRRRPRDRFRNAAKRLSTGTCSDRDLGPNTSCSGAEATLESVLHSFLNTTRPRGLARRRAPPQFPLQFPLPPCMLSPVRGSPTETCPQANSLAGEPETGAGQSVDTVPRENTLGGESDGVITLEEQDREETGEGSPGDRAGSAALGEEELQLEVKEEQGESCQELPTETEKEEGEKATPLRGLRSGSNRPTPISYKCLSKSCGQSPLQAQEEMSEEERTEPKEERREDEKEDEDVRWICEVSRQVLHYQTSRGSSSDDLTGLSDGRGTPPTSLLPPQPSSTQPATRCSRRMREEDLALYNSTRPFSRRGPAPHPSTPRCRGMREVELAGCNLGSPWVVLSPQVTHGNHTPHQWRHSFNAPGDDGGLEDGVWALPPTPTRMSTPTHPSTTTRPSLVLLGQTRTEKQPSGDPNIQQDNGWRPSSLPDCPSQRAPSQVPVLRPRSLDDVRGAAGSGFRLGDLFQRHSNLGPLTGHDTRSLEGQSYNSGILSFFRHFGERRRVGSEEQYSRGKWT
ncbi:hypothetical protein UPYG_G00128990 [Umbra pygmaea]|uniref:FH2 domain-containing protein n=1 Tax=Umbra pygmaea TaxID=75934 RepID=A0ABD0X6V2_UMBPY